MKKSLALLATAGILAAATAAFGASIVNSKHDLSNGSTVGGVSGSYTKGSSTQICIYCHAPHNANLSLPLWNRSNPAGSGFTLYSGVGMANASFKSGFTSDSTSLFCMSCHDGVTLLSAVHNAGVIDGDTLVNPRTAAAGVFTGSQGVGQSAKSGGNLGKDLSKTHPINFPVLNDNQADLHVGTLTAPSMGKTGWEMPLFKSSHADSRRATSNRSLECGSCHAVHDTANKPFLRYTMGGSGLCLGCHNK